MSSWNVHLVRRSGCILAILVLFLAGAGRAHAQGADCTGVSPSTTGSVTWTPQWCEEFNAATAGAPDTTVWSFDLGNGGFGNNEIETYCGPPGYAGNPSNCPTTFSASTSNAYLDGGGPNGHLVIQAINNNGTWFSARMKTQGLQDFQYGRIEASIQLPDTTNQGLWPAFWSLGSNIATVPWPACGETDVMEVWSTSVLNGPGPTGNRSTLHTSVTKGFGLQPNGSFTFLPGQANNTGFHTYGMIWSANMQQFYIDDPLHPYYIATLSDLPSGDTWPFNAKLFLLTNIAVGGTLGGTPSGATPNPAIMTFDYVRQYQAAAVPAPALGTPPAISLKAGATSGNSSTFNPALTTGTGYVYFSCSTNAPKATCSVATTDPLNTHVINSSAPAPESVTVSVMTTTNAAAFPSTPTTFLMSPKMRVWLPIALVGLILSTFLAQIQRGRSRAWLCNCTLIAGLILMGAGTPSCGGGSNNTQVTPPGNNGTPPGSYTVTVYAFTESNAGNGSNSSADASVAIPLTVN
jgi:beta-glucanase (GH16 family)